MKLKLYCVLKNLLRGYILRQMVLSQKTRGKEETCGGDGYAHGVVCGDGPMGEYISL